MRAAPIVALLLLTRAVRAEVPYEVEDRAVVARAEVIVVARLKPGSIRDVPHPKDEGSREYHATLLVTRVLKGGFTGKELPFVIHYGLEPILDRTVRRGDEVFEVETFGVDNPRPGIIEICPTNHEGGPLVPDARDDHLWFLRRKAPEYKGHRAAPDRLGIYWDQDLQPLRFEPFVKALLAPDPDAAMRAALASAPADVAARGLDYLYLREVERILALPDKARRAERLLPYFAASGRFVAFRVKAAGGLAACGSAVAGPLLVALCERSSGAVRVEAVALLAQIGHRAAIPVLEKGVDTWGDDPASVAACRRALARLRG